MACPIVPTLHIPLRSPPYDDTKHMQNYLAIQRWADRIFADCFEWSAGVVEVPPA